MKRNKIYLFFLSGLLLAACSKEDEPASTPGGEDAFATVSVAVDGINGRRLMAQQQIRALRTRMKSTT